MPMMRWTLERMRQGLAEIFRDLRPGILSLDIFGHLAGPALFREIVDLSSSSRRISASAAPLGEDQIPRGQRAALA
jgi:hypothetical protein